MRRVNLLSAVREVRQAAPGVARPLAVGVSVLHSLSPVSKVTAPASLNGCPFDHRSAVLARAPNTSSPGAHTPTGPAHPSRNTEQAVAAIGDIRCSCHTRPVVSVPMGSSYVYRTVRVRLGVLSDADKLRVWRLRSEQSQAFNLGVELALAAAEKGMGCRGSTRSTS